MEAVGADHVITDADVLRAVMAGDEGFVGREVAGRRVGAGIAQHLPPSLSRAS